MPGDGFYAPTEARPREFDPSCTMLTFSEPPLRSPSGLYAVNRVRASRMACRRRLSRSWCAANGDRRLSLRAAHLARAASIRIRLRQVSNSSVASALTTGRRDAGGRGVTALAD